MPLSHLSHSVVVRERLPNFFVFNHPQDLLLISILVPALPFSPYGSSGLPPAGLGGPVNISSLILAAIAVLMVGAVAFGLTMSVRACLRYHGKRVKHKITPRYRLM
jgi:hypothetical protein